MFALYYSCFAVCLRSWPTPPPTPSASPKAPQCSSTSFPPPPPLEPLSPAWVSLGISPLPPRRVSCGTFTRCDDCRPCGWSVGHCPYACVCIFWIVCFVCRILVCQMFAFSFRLFDWRTWSCLALCLARMLTSPSGQAHSTAHSSQAASRKLNIPLAYGSFSVLQLCSFRAVCSVRAC